MAEPTNFILRAHGYPQNPAYGAFCADTSHKLAQWLVRQRGSGVKVDGQAVAKFLEGCITPSANKLGHPDRPEPDKEMFGKVTPYGGGRTPLPSAYARQAIFAHENLGPATEFRSGEAYVMFDEGDDPIALSKLSRYGPAPGASALEKRLFLGDFSYVDNYWLPGLVVIDHECRERERARKVLDQSLEEALGGSEEASLKAYYLYSHLTPHIRGSATAARILFEALAEVNGFRTYPCAEERNMNWEALTRNWRDFLKAYKARAFLDPVATPQDVHDWVSAEKQGKKEPFGLKQFVWQAFRAATLGDKMEACCPFEALLKELTKPPPVASVDDPEIKKHCLGAEPGEAEFVMKRVLHLQPGIATVETPDHTQKRVYAVRFENGYDLEYTDVPIAHMLQGVEDEAYRKAHRTAPEYAVADDLEMRLQDKPSRVLTMDGTLADPVKFEALQSFKALEPHFLNTANPLTLSRCGINGASLSP